MHCSSSVGYFTTQLNFLRLSCQSVISQRPGVNRKKKVLQTNVEHKLEGGILESMRRNVELGHFNILSVVNTQ